MARTQPLHRVKQLSFQIGGKVVISLALGRGVLIMRRRNAEPLFELLKQGPHFGKLNLADFKPDLFLVLAVQVVSTECPSKLTRRRRREHQGSRSDRGRCRRGFRANVVVDGTEGPGAMMVASLQEVEVECGINVRQWVELLRWRVEVSVMIGIASRVRQGNDFGNQGGNGEDMRSVGAVTYVTVDHSSTKGSGFFDLVEGVIP